MKRSNVMYGLVGALAMVAGLAGASVASATRAVAFETEVVAGVISAVDMKAMTFTLTLSPAPEASEPETVTVHFNTETEFTLDGKAAAASAALAAGRDAIVTHEDLVALRVDVTTPEQPE
jgi:hypothetical protein